MVVPDIFPRPNLKNRGSSWGQLGSCVLSLFPVCTSCCLVLTYFLLSPSSNCPCPCMSIPRAITNESSIHCINYFIIIIFFFYKHRSRLEEEYSGEETRSQETQLELDLLFLRVCFFVTSMHAFRNLMNLITQPFLFIQFNYRCQS